MATFFTETYRKYYDKLSNTSFNTQSIQDRVLEIKNNTKKLVTSVESSSWKEKGKDELLSNIIPNLSEKIDIFASNITNNLVAAVNKSKDELLPALEDLLSKEERATALEQLIAYNNENEVDNTKNNEELNALIEESKTISTKIDTIVSEIKALSTMKELNNTSTAAISNVEVKAEEPKKEENTSSNSTLGYTPVSSEETVEDTTINIDEENELSAIDSRIDEIRKRIRSRKSNAKDFVSEFLKIKLSLEQNKRSKFSSSAESISNYSSNSNVKTWSGLDGNWIVCNTKIGIDEYASYAYGKGIRQDSNSSRYGDLCLAFSYVHASNMYNGSTGDNAESAYNWAHAGEFKDYFSDSKEATLTTIYKEITAGKPVVLQVNGNKSGTSRHFVTVVGFKEGVNSASELKEEDLLIYDSWDGKVERMDTNSSRFMTTGKQTGKTYSGYYLRILK